MSEPGGRTARVARPVEWALLALAVAASAGFGWIAWRALQGARSAAPERGPANVLLISLDTLRADRLSCYGYRRPTTPHLDALAGESLRFARCAAVSNWTLPTHASMFTGLYPDRHGARFLTADDVEGVTAASAMGVLLEPCETMAERLLTAGYRTGAIVANYALLARIYQVDQGFETYDARPGRPGLDLAPSAAHVTERAIGWLEENDRRPFFLFLNYMDPHSPYNPAPEHLARFETDPKADREPKPVVYFNELTTRVLGNHLSGRDSESDAAMRWVSNRYDAEIAYLDEHLGRLFEYLRRAGLFENTLVIVTSDHGEGLGEHGVFGHCMRLYENELAVPLIVKLPGRSTPGVIDQRVSQIDLLPTVLEVLGLPVDAGLDGRSLISGTGSPRDLIAKKDTDLRMATGPRELAQTQWAVYRGALKYIEYAAGPAQLYDLDADPAEAHDLASARPQEAASMQQALKDYRQRARPIAPLASFNPQGDARQLRGLRELGYAQ